MRYIHTHTDCGESTAGALRDVRNPQFPGSVANEVVLMIGPRPSAFCIERGAKDKKRMQTEAEVRVFLGSRAGHSFSAASQARSLASIS
jgi:hypothetical protein